MCALRVVRAGGEGGEGDNERDFLQYSACRMFFRREFGGRAKIGPERDTRVRIERCWNVALILVVVLGAGRAGQGRGQGFLRFPAGAR